MIDVKVYSLKGCADTPATLALVKTVAENMNLEIDLHQIELTSNEDVEKYRFPGSPTVRINGIDIDPEMRDTSHFGMT